MHCDLSSERLAVKQTSVFLAQTWPKTPQRNHATQLIVCTARICGYASPIGEQRGCTCGVCLEKKTYLFGGTVDPFSLNALVSCKVYDITLNEWQSIAPLQVPRFHGSAVLLRDQVYLFGGTGSQSVDRQNSRMVECYDIKSNTWLDAHSMPYNETYFRGCPVSMFQDLLQSVNNVATLPQSS